MKQRHFNYKVMQDYIKENNMTIKKFCEECNISYSQYRRILNDDNVYISALFRVSRFLKVPFCEMFRIDDSVENRVELYK